MVAAAAAAREGGNALSSVTVQVPWRSQQLRGVGWMLLLVPVCGQAQTMRYSQHTVRCWRLVALPGKLPVGYLQRMQKVEEQAEMRRQQLL